MGLFSRISSAGRTRTRSWPCTMWSGPSRATSSTLNPYTGNHVRNTLLVWIRRSLSSPTCKYQKPHDTLVMYPGATPRAKWTRKSGGQRMVWMASWKECQVLLRPPLRPQIVRRLRREGVTSIDWKCFSQTYVSTGRFIRHCFCTLFIFLSPSII